MTDSAAAFANFPSEARGILLCDTYAPISLHTADVHVLFSGHAAQVTLSLEYVNETNRLVKAIAAYPVPSDFQLQYTTLTGPNRAITNNVYQPTCAVKSSETSSGRPAKSLYDIMTSAVATQTVPWGISPGDSVLMTSVYHAPLALIQRQSEIAFTMPTALFPAVVRPPEEQRNYVKTSDSCSSNTRVGKAGWLYLTVEGQLYRPLRGSVTLDKDGYIIAPGGEEQLKVEYRGDSGFCLTYQGKLPTKTYTQQPLTVRAPVGDIMEPLRLHSVTVPPTETAAGAAAVALTMAPNFADCPVNAELVFLMDVHTAAMAQDVAEAIAAAISPAISPMPATVRANIVLCSDTRRNGCVTLFPTGSVAVAAISPATMLAYIKEEVALTTTTTKAKKGSVAPAAVYSLQLPAVLHDILSGRNAATAVPEGYVRNVILLTDAGGLAAATESAAMVCDAITYATNTRVHCVALGPAADHATLETLALATGGRYRAPATTTVPTSSKLVANCDLVTALRQVLVAAAVPCLANVRTLWKLVAKSRVKTAGSPAPVGIIRLAANATGTDLPCIPRNTKRVLYGLISPPEKQPQSAANDNNNGSNADSSAAVDDFTLMQLNVRVVGRVGNLSLEFTASTLITRIADVVASVAAAAAAAAAAEQPKSATTVSGLDDGFAMLHQDLANEANAAERTGDDLSQPSHPQQLSMKDITPQDDITNVSPERDSVSASSLNKTVTSSSAASPTSTLMKQNGKTLLLHTAAAAARIAFLSSGHHAVSAEEAQEMIELSRRCMLPSPYTTLTDGTTPLTAGQKKGGVVYMPSVGAKAQFAVEIRTRQAIEAAAAPSSPSKEISKDKGGKSADKQKKKASTKGKDTVSLYSTRV